MSFMQTDLAAFYCTGDGLYVVVHTSLCRLLSVCNVCAPYSGDWNFR